MTPDATARQRHDALQATLSTRKSTVHFAHAGVSTVAMIILFGTSARLFWKGDAEDELLGWVSGTLAAALFTYAVLRLLLARTRLKVELADYARLRELRNELGLDDPGRLIPR